MRAMAHGQALELDQKDNTETDSHPAMKRYELFTA